jgi:predicted phage terminase large subunit-like protein
MARHERAFDFGDARMKERQALVAQRLLQAREAHDNLGTFIHHTMPDPRNPDDPSRTLYRPSRVHELFCRTMEAVEAGKYKRLIVTVPPRHGKTEHFSLRGSAWFLGRNPTKNVILATYNQDLADQHGEKVRELIASPAFNQVFPDVRLTKGVRSKRRIGVDTNGIRGGDGYFVGRGGAITGRGGHLLIVDDLFKDQEEAQSPTIRNTCWEWFTTTFMTRLMNKDSAVLIIMTRWHEDDVIGRLTNKDNPHYNPKVAKDWHIINLKALAEDDDPLGRKVDEPLWPEIHSTKSLKDMRAQMGVTAFSCVFQSNPTPAEGVTFQREWFDYYNFKDLPANCRYYVASDHAVKSGQKNDYTVFICGAVDEKGILYIVDMWRKKASSMGQVKSMLWFADKYKPLIWFAERTHITQSIGPFLKQQMQETGTWINIREMAPKEDKMQRSQSIQGMMGMGLVKIPRNASWLHHFENELLSFPNGQHDDIVDTMSYLGLGVKSMVKASAGGVGQSGIPPTGTLGWVKYMTNRARLNAFEHADGF